MTATPSLLLPARPRALLFSAVPLRGLEVDPPTDLCEVVGRLVPENGEGGGGRRRKIEEAVEAARAEGATLIVVPSEDDPIFNHPRHLYEVLAATGISLVALSPSLPGNPPFDSRDEHYMAAWRTLLYRPRPKRKAWAPCVCGHRVTGPDAMKPGHTIEEGDEAPRDVCSDPHDSCTRYRPRLRARA